MHWNRHTRMQKRCQSTAGFTLRSFIAAVDRRHDLRGAAYPEQRELWPLFDACGEERVIGYGNPYKPGENKK